MIQEMFDENLSIENSSVNELSLFPNPTDGIISLGSDKNYQLEIYSLEGKIILNDFGNEIDISSIQNGTYFLKITQENTNIVLFFVSLYDHALLQFSIKTV